MLAGLLACATANAAPASAPESTPLAASPDPERIPEAVDDPEEGDEPPLREVPLSGRGMLVAGTLLTLVGSGLLATGIVAAVQDWTLGDLPVALPVLTLVTGAGAVAGGGALLHGGVERHRVHRQWRAAQPDDVPPTGIGMVVVGGVAMVGGAQAVVVGATAWYAEVQTALSDYKPSPSPGSVASVAVGVTAVVVGTTVLAAGAHRHQRFNAWRRETAGVDVRPSISAGRRGFSLGVAGRF